MVLLQHLDRYNSIMPGQIHRKDDENDAGAKITSTKQTAVKVGGQRCNRRRSRSRLLDYPHASPNTANGNQFVKIGGIPVNRQGHEDSCVCSRPMIIPRL